jgi:antitoxin HicB
VRTPYSYPAMMEEDEGGRYVVRFADLPEALTDGAYEGEALAEAADCLSEALASRIVEGEEIPEPTFDQSPTAGFRILVSPDPTIALKAALYMTLRRRDMTVADLADRLGLRDWHQAARLIDPKRPSKLKRLAAALDALGCTIEIAVSDGATEGCRPTAETPLPQDAQYDQLLLAAEKIFTRLIDAELGPTLGRDGLAKVVDAAVQGYVARNRLHFDPIARRKLITALIKGLIDRQLQSSETEDSSSRSVA